MTTTDKAKIKAAQARYYQNNKQKYFDHNKLKRLRMRQHLDEVKAVPCMDCRVSYPPYVMDLDHRPDEVKLYEPSNLVNIGSWTKLKDEVAKCDVVCSNCHRQRSHDRRQGSEDL